MVWPSHFSGMQDSYKGLHHTSLMRRSSFLGEKRWIKIIWVFISFFPSSWHFLFYPLLGGQSRETAELNFFTEEKWHAPPSPIDCVCVVLFLIFAVVWGLRLPWESSTFLCWSPSPLGNGAGQGTLGEMGQCEVPTMDNEGTLLTSPATMWDTHVTPQPWAINGSSPGTKSNRHLQLGILRAWETLGNKLPSFPSHPAYGSF